TALETTTMGRRFVPVAPVKLAVTTSPGFSILLFLQGAVDVLPASLAEVHQILVAPLFAVVHHGARVNVVEDQGRELQPISGRQGFDGVLVDFLNGHGVAPWGSGRFMGS